MYIQALVRKTEIMSESLDPIAKARYREKLDLLGINEQFEPYISDDDFTSSWPPIEFGHIYCYFIERPGVYTKQQLMHWKSLEAYNYFVSRHVKICFGKSDKSNMLHFVSHCQSEHAFL